MNLKESWKITTSYLEAAFSMLPKGYQPNIEEGGTAEGYKDYLAHNELELALDELEGLGGGNNVSIEYWVNLLNAAKQMGLKEKVEQYKYLINKEKS